MSLPSRLLGANPSIQVSALLSGSLSTPSAKQAFVEPGSFESIFTSALTGDTANVDFTYIPQTYQHLQVRLIARDSRNDSSVGNPINYRFNSDTGANYTYHYLYGASGSASAGAATSATEIPAYTIATTSANANTFGGAISDILDYSNANKFKTVRTIGGLENNGGNQSVFFTQGVWRNTAAITSIRLLSVSFNLKQYSHIALYGIKGA